MKIAERIFANIYPVQFRADAKREITDGFWIQATNLNVLAALPVDEKTG